MLKEISKKLTMKKTFFITQLEGFFNAISHEYQEIIHQKELENSILEEKIAKCEKDIKNLVSIKEDLILKISEQDEYIKNLEKRVNQSQNENKGENFNLEHFQEVEKLKEQIQKLQNIISKGAKSYKDTLHNQNKEALIEEITKTLKK